MPPNLELDWPTRLYRRRGAPIRLDGIEVFYDFRWRKEFPNGRAQFRNGLCLAKMARAEAPPEKTPALLLTTRHDAEEGARDAGDYYVLVVQIRRYLALADGNAAVSYVASMLGPGLTRAVRFADLAGISSDQLAQLLDLRLDEKMIAKWAGMDSERLALLRRLGDEEASSVSKVAAAVRALEALDRLEPEVVTALADLVGRQPDTESLLDLVGALTADVDGRYAVGEILADRTDDRLHDARAAVTEYQRLIEDPSIGETAMQNFLEANPWILGLDYARVRPRHETIRGFIDFILERYDGYHDLLELKGPDDPLFELPVRRRRERRPSASDVRLSKPLALALAQVHVYRDALRHEDVNEQDYGLRNARDPRILIVLGRAASLDDHERRIWRELNRSLHRVEIVPYDVVGQRAEAILGTVGRYLIAAEEPSS